jgi:hypothetical protein
MFIGCPIAFAFASAADMTLRASSSVTIISSAPDSFKIPTTIRQQIIAWQIQANKF